MRKRLVAVICAAAVLIAAAGAAAFVLLRPKPSDPVKAPDRGADDLPLYYELSGDRPEERYALSEITPENARRAIAGIKEPDDYYRVCRVERFSDGESSAVDIKVWHSGGKYRVETSGAENKTVIHDGARTLIKNNDRGTERVIEGDADFSCSEQIGIVDIDYFTRDPDNETVDASFAGGRGSNVFFIRFDYKKFDQREEFFISADLGAVTSAVTFMNGVMTYRLTTSEFIRDHVSDESIYEIGQ